MSTQQIRVVPGSQVTESGRRILTFVSQSSDFVGTDLTSKTPRIHGPHSTTIPAPNLRILFSLVPTDQRAAMDARRFQ